MPKKFPNKNYKNVIEYYNDYSKSLNETLVLIKSNQIKNVLSLLNKSIQNRKNIFICGNGGSSSVSNHFLCDFQKGLLLDKKLRLRTYSLSSNTDLITAISNDLNYNKIFSLQLDSLADQNDLLIIFSVSGKSGNIIEAAKSAKKKKMKVISFVGFKNSTVKKFSNVCIEFNNKNYGISEDVFQILMHVYSQYIRQKNLSNRVILNKNF